MRAGVTTATSYTDDSGAERAAGRAEDFHFVLDDRLDRIDNGRDEFHDRVLVRPGRQLPFQRRTVCFAYLAVIILAAGGPASLHAARDATKTIPIVMVASSRDPIGDGLIKSYAHPGGNITGLVTAPEELTGKQLEVLREARPGLSRAGVLWDATTGPFVLDRPTAEVARALGVELVPLEVRGPADFETSIVTATKERIGGLIVQGSPIFVRHRTRIADLLTKHRLPGISVWSAFAEAGVLLTYGPSLPDLFRRAAVYVDKILRGANPGEIPVERPTKFELVINMKTAKALGLTIPQTLLLRADQMIE